MGLALLVDDDAQVRRVIRRSLLELGYSVLEADDGAAALAIGMQRLAGFGKRLQPVMHHAPDVGEDDLHAVHEVAQPLRKTQ